MTDATLPLVSIVVRTRGDREAWLLDALRSVAKQSWPAIECVLCWNDLAGDACENLVSFLERHKQELHSVRGTTTWLRPILVGYQRSAGVAGAWGVRNASGEFVGLLDDDDVLRSWHAERLAQRLISEPTAAAAYSDVLLVPSDDHNLPTGERPTRQEGPWGREALFSGPCPRAENAFLFRSSVLELDGQLPSHHVHDFLLRLPAATTARLLHAPGLGAEKRVRTPPPPPWVLEERQKTLEMIVARARRLDELRLPPPPFVPDETSPPGGPA